MAVNTEKSYTITVKFKTFEEDAITAEALRAAVEEFIQDDASVWLDIMAEVEVTVAADQE